jgi:hypothetical protein
VGGFQDFFTVDSVFFAEVLPVLLDGEGGVDEGSCEADECQISEFLAGQRLV